MTDRDAAPRVVVVGEALVDIVHRADGRVDESPGGSPANVALALGRLGRAPRLVTRLGDDRHGRGVRAWLIDSEVTVDAVPALRTATATARLDAAGAAEYEFDLEWALEGASVADADIVHAGSIGALLPPGGDEVARLAADLAGTALVTFDPNVRPSLLGDPAAARTRVTGYLGVADVVKASEEDLAWLHPDLSPLEAAQRWHDAGPAVVVVTRGGEGCLAVTDAGVLEVPAVTVSVVDTVGAGDTFMGTLIDGLLGAGYRDVTHRARLRGIPPAELEAILRVCAEAAAIAVSRPGADPPSRAELDSTISARLQAATSTKG
ncbi:carbohydrate kinase [Microbacterium sp. B2969]|uniref:Carbohydrate kinase n=1 Tax=Microbacterium alkaliflavum TaxID=3248839 RepID=A0ABW7QBP2_9MICO